MSGNPGAVIHRQRVARNDSVLLLFRRSLSRSVSRSARQAVRKVRRVSIRARDSIPSA
jgi:hypothetical protein